MSYSGGSKGGSGSSMQRPSPWQQSGVYGAGQGGGAFDMNSGWGQRPNYGYGGFNPRPMPPQNWGQMQGQAQSQPNNGGAFDMNNGWGQRPPAQPSWAQQPPQQPMTANQGMPFRPQMGGFSNPKLAGLFAQFGGQSQPQPMYQGLLNHNQCSGQAY